jgi:hypothetical protein
MSEAKKKKNVAMYSTCTLGMPKPGSKTPSEKTCKFFNAPIERIFFFSSAVGVLRLLFDAGEFHGGKITK